MGIFVGISGWLIVKYFIGGNLRECFGGGYFFVVTVVFRSLGKEIVNVK